MDTLKFTYITPTPTHLNRGDFKTLQNGNVTVTTWMDRRLVRAMSTAHDPTKVTTVQRRQRDGTRCPIACPDMIKQYNMQKGGVDHGDQIGGGTE